MPGLWKTVSLLFLPYYRPAGAGGQGAEGEGQGAESMEQKAKRLVIGYWSLVIGD